MQRRAVLEHLHPVRQASDAPRFRRPARATAGAPEVLPPRRPRASRGRRRAAVTIPSSRGVRRPGTGAASAPAACPARPGAPARSESAGGAGETPPWPINDRVRAVGRDGEGRGLKSSRSPGSGRRPRPRPSAPPTDGPHGTCLRRRGRAALVRPALAAPFLHPRVGGGGEGGAWGYKETRRALGGGRGAGGVGAARAMKKGGARNADLLRRIAAYCD